MICNPLCGEPPASGARVCSMGARGGTTSADANYVAVWQINKLSTLIYCHTILHKANLNASKNNVLFATKWLA